LRKGDPGVARDLARCRGDGRQGVERREHPPACRRVGGVVGLRRAKAVGGDHGGRAVESGHVGRELTRGGPGPDAPRAVVKRADRFDWVPMTEYLVDVDAGTVIEHVLDQSFSARKAHPASPVHEGTVPGSYVPAGG